MAHQKSSSGILAGTITVLGLGLLWVTVFANFPSQEELSSTGKTIGTGQTASPSSPLSEPAKLDLSIPISPPVPSDATMPRPDDQRSQNAPGVPPAVTKLDSSTPQATRLKCEAEMELMCPGSLDGSARTSCLEQRAQQLPPLCQSQLRERFVKWKEDRTRLVAACDVDIRRFCGSVKPGGGEILQCLQSHGQEVSDPCYQILPKGTVFFK